jgi:RES domain
MNCCAECFGDRHLRQEIAKNSIEVGDCSYCHTSNIAILPPPRLAEYFELLIGSYTPDPAGRPLVNLFREDWRMFQHPGMSDSVVNDLIADVLNNPAIVEETYVAASPSHADHLSEWNKFRDELKYQNRFFPKLDLDLERLEFLLSSLIPDGDEVPIRWFRSRIQSGEVPFDISEMGAPPKRTASFGRANPAGIPYLYLASSPETAVSEVRPHTGEIACVAEFTTPGDLRVVDLRAPREMVSPFILEDASEIGRLRDDLPFLERLGEELTLPVVPQAAAIDYTPSQYVCEFIKSLGYDGVIYRSSVSDGINLALFDPGRARPMDVMQYQVQRVKVDVIRR